MNEEYYKTRCVVRDVAEILEKVTLAIESHRRCKLGKKATFLIWNQLEYLVYIRLSAETTVLNNIYNRLASEYDTTDDDVIDSFFFTEKSFYSVVEEVCKSIASAHFSMFDYSVLSGSNGNVLIKKLFRERADVLSVYLKEITDLKKKLEEGFITIDCRS